MIVRNTLLWLLPLLALNTSCGGESCADGSCGTPGGAGSSGASGSSAGSGAIPGGGKAGASGTGGTGTGTGGASTAGTSAGGASTAGAAGATSNGGAGGAQDPGAPLGSPVWLHGKLSVSGKQLHDQLGDVVQLKGISSMWLNWEDDGYAESEAALRFLRDEWKIEVIRAAMGIEPEDAYLEDPTKAKEQVDTIVENAIALGLYVIIDWHDHEALSHQAEAEAFFDEVAGKYGQHPNVLYEVFNEPLDVAWSAQLKPYHQALTAKIRAKDPDNLIILGTPRWSQDVDAAAADPVAGTNLLYTLHFYACEHGAWLRDKAESALAQNLPLFVTEWGATPADGGVNGEVCESDGQDWHTFLNTHQISSAAWKFDGCDDSSCLLKEGAPADGPFTDEWLQGHGPFVRARLLE